MKFSEAEEIDRIVNKKDYLKQKYLGKELSSVLSECEKLVSDWRQSDTSDSRLQRLYRMQVNFSIHNLIKVIEKMC